MTRAGKDFSLGYPTPSIPGHVEDCSISAYRKTPFFEDARAPSAPGIATIAFSADLGPDLLVPWRHPTLTVVYTNVAHESVATGLVPAEGRAGASIIARWTSDATLLTPSPVATGGGRNPAH